MMHRQTITNMSPTLGTSSALLGHNSGTRWIGRAVVLGAAAAQGSKKFVGMAKKTGRPIMADDDKRLKNWRQQMQSAMDECKPGQPIDGPVRVDITVLVARPKGHYGTGGRANFLKPSAPALPYIGRDLDKVARAVLDAGSRIWWCDDSRVVKLIINRFFHDEGRESVTVTAEAL